MQEVIKGRITSGNIGLFHSVQNESYFYENIMKAHFILVLATHQSKVFSFTILFKLSPTYDNRKSTKGLWKQNQSKNKLK